MKTKLKVGRKSISSQFILLILVFFVMFAIGSVVLINAQQNIAETFDEQRKELTKKEKLIIAIKKDLNEAFLQARGYIAFDNESMYEQALSRKEPLQQNIDELFLLADEKDQAMIRNLDNFVNVYFTETMPTFKDVYVKKGIEEIRKSQKRKDATAGVEKVQQDLNAYQQQLSDEIDVAYADASTNMNQSQWFFIGLLGFSLLVLVVLTRVLLKRVGKPLNELAYVASEIADGKDLSYELDEKREDEIGVLSNAFYKMVRSLQANEQELLAQNEELTAQQDELHSQQDELQSALDKMKEREHELESRNDFIDELKNSLKKQEVLDSIVKNMRKVMRVDYGFIALLNEKGHASIGLSNSAVDQALTNLDSHLALLKEEHQPVVIKRLCQQSEKLYHEKEMYVYDVVVPVISSKGELIACMCYSRYTNDFSSNDLDTFSALSKQVALTLEKINIYEESEHDRLLSQDVLNSIKEGIQLVDVSGKVLQVNTNICEIFGCQHSKTVLNSPLDEWTKQISERVDNSEELLAFITDTINMSKNRQSTVIYQVNIAGVNRVIQVYSEYVYRNRQHFGVLFVHRDITKEFEVDQMKSEFVSTVSHELRTPLASVLGFTELMLNKTLRPERQTKYLNTIYQEAQRLTALINDFLDVQKMESGTQTYHKNYVNLVPVLKQVVNVQQVNAGKHTFDIITSSEDLIVFGDEDKLIQLFNNLIHNAVKYSPDGGNVQIKALAEHDKVHISIKDEGIGIPEEAINKLFTKFYRVDNSDMRKIGGTGLGLSIVKEIVKSHQGEIKVNSEWKKGSTFTVSLPLMTTHSVEQIEQEKEDGKRSIIIIEDDKSLASLLQVELKESGFYVRHFDRGEAAIEAIQANPPEAIVLDIMLHEHEMNGWDILKMLKGDPTTEHIPIFISSALDEKNKGMEFGAYAYLVKPYQPSKLTNTILQMIVEKNEGNGEILVPRSDTE
ncbi:ATP-binding protein [Bacillus sp. CBEL-1]|uniref:ATP-binding protein n=1 Tax=Bacillus sp. CBEL-1 TaxID=2502980 RepID=UPI00104F1258|nr:ATP-binding protein [Bacillus sp. CBEL-1]TDB53064.1 response regulator [Bacillus sp. CBEL-1]